MEGPNQGPRSIISKEDGWYYLDETWDDRGNGPYATQLEAEIAQLKYCLYQLGGHTAEQAKKLEMALEEKVERFKYGRT